MTLRPLGRRVPSQGPFVRGELPPLISRRCWRREIHDLRLERHRLLETRSPREAGEPVHPVARRGWSSDDKVTAEPTREGEHSSQLSEPAHSRR